MRTNNRMNEMMEGCSRKSDHLAQELRAILDGGLVYRDGCLLLKSRLELTEPYSRERFHDETGYESFANHVHLDDLPPSAGTCQLLAQALAFADALSVMETDAGISEPLEFIVAGDENGLTVRFHVCREGQFWLADDLNGHEEAVAAISLPRRDD
jgi:hypothetical protein